MADEIKKTEIKPKIAQMTDLEYEAVRFVIRQRDTSQSEVTNLQGRWDRAYKLWLRYKPQPKQGRVRVAKLFTPLVFNIIQTITPLIVLSIFSVRRFLFVQPTEDNDEETAKNIADLLAYQIKRIPAWFHTMVSWIKGCLLYGTAILSPGWIDETTEVPVFEHKRILGVPVARVPVMEEVPVLDEFGAPVMENAPIMDEVTGAPVYDRNGAPLLELRPKMELKQKTRREGYYGPNFTNVPLDNFRKDPSAKVLQKARWAYDEENMSEIDLRSAVIPGTDKPFYRNMNLLKDIQPMSESEKANAEKLAAGGNNADQSIDDFCKMHTRQNYWGVMPQKFLYIGNENGLSKLSDDEKEKPVRGNLCILDDQLLILARENDEELYHGKLPYIAIIDIMDLESFYGVGEAYPVEDAQHEHNNCRNQWLTASRRDLNQRKYVDRAGNIDMHAMKYAGDGGIVLMNGINSVKEEPNSFNYDAAMARDKVIKQEIIETSSMYPQIGMEQPGSGIKATVYASFEQAVLKKFRFKAMMIEEMGIKEIGRWTMMLNALYMTEDYSFRVLNKKITVSMDDMQQQYDYIPMGSASEPLSSLEARREGLNSVLETVSKIPGAAATLNLEAWGRDLCEVHGIQGYKEKFNNPVEVFFQQFKHAIAQAVDAGVDPAQVLYGIIEQETAMGSEGSARPGGAPAGGSVSSGPSAGGMDPRLTASVRGMMRKYSGDVAAGGS